MADPPSSPSRHPSAGRGPTAGTPRWVKVSGIIVLTVVWLLVIVLLASGNHGPGRHQSSRGLGSSLPSVGAATRGWR